MERTVTRNKAALSREQGYRGKGKVKTRKAHKTFADFSPLVSDVFTERNAHENMRPQLRMPAFSVAKSDINQITVRLSDVSLGSNSDQTHIH